MEIVQTESVGQTVQSDYPSDINKKNIKKVEIKKLI